MPNEHPYLRVVHGAKSIERPTAPRAVAYAAWEMQNLRTEGGYLGKVDGQLVIDRRGSRAQIISLGALNAVCRNLADQEAVHFRLCLTQARNGYLEALVIAVGDTQSDADNRRGELQSSLDAALKTGLPHVEMVATQAPSKLDLPHIHVLVPAGDPLPLLASVPEAASDRDAVTKRARKRQHDVVQLPPMASISDLASLTSLLPTLRTDIIIDMKLEQFKFDEAALELVESAHNALQARQTSDIQNMLSRNDTYNSAVNDLEHLLVDQHGARLTATVHAGRKLNAIELSLISGAIFGAAHNPKQIGRFEKIRAIYPRENAVVALLGFALAGVAPCNERRQTAELESQIGLQIGKTKTGHTVKMPVENPRNHTYIPGRSGTGKSTLIANMALQDIADGRAVIVFDPHGDLCDDIYMRVPKDRLKDVLYFHCADPEAYPILNAMELRSDADPKTERSRVVDNVKRMIRRVLYPGYDPDAFGPMYEDLIQATLYLLIEALGDKSRLVDVERLVTDRRWRHELLRMENVTDETKRKWKKYEDVDENWHKLENLTPYVTSKVAVFTQNELVKPILDGRDLDDKALVRHTLDFEKALRQKKIILLNLAVTAIGEQAATLLGGLATMKLYEAAKRQPRDAKNERPSAAVYLDEFQTYATEILADTMAETRKFGLRITLANQTLGQLRGRGRDHLHAILGNAGNLVLFGVDTEDAVYLSQRFPGVLAPSELGSLPNYEAICRFQSQSKAFGPLLIRTEPPTPELRRPPKRDI